MAVSKFLSFILCVSIAALAVPAQACRVPCSQKIVKAFEKELSKLKRIDGDFKLLSRTPKGDGSEVTIVTGQIETTNGKQIKIAFEDPGIIIIGCCPTYVIPGGDAQGKFYLKRGPNGAYVIVHWEGK